MQEETIQVSYKKIGSDLNTFIFQQMKAPEVTKLLKQIDVKKAVGVKTILPKLIKIHVDIVAEPLTLVINCCLRQDIFLIMLRLLPLLLTNMAF